LQKKIASTGGRLAHDLLEHHAAEADGGRARVQPLQRRRVEARLAHRCASLPAAAGCADRAAPRRRRCGGGRAQQVARHAPPPHRPCEKPTL
jgi:hypothetical protein